MRFGDGSARMRAAKPSPACGEGWEGARVGHHVGRDDRRQWRVGQRQRKQARTLRHPHDRAEQRLWLELRAHRLGGLSFRRQHPIAGYVADFACLPLKLVIELDGGQHFGVQVWRVTRGVIGFWRKQGFRVLRFSNLDSCKICRRP